MGRGVGFELIVGVVGGCALVREFRMQGDMRVIGLVRVDCRVVF